MYVFFYEEVALLENKIMFNLNAIILGLLPATLLFCHCLLSILKLRAIILFRLV